MPAQEEDNDAVKLGPLPSDSVARGRSRLIEQEARRLTRIVEDMFVLARADAGHPTLRPALFHLDELVAETARMAGVLAAQAGVRIETPAGSDRFFCGDEGLLRQMIQNLLDNSLKHTPAGGVVRIQLESEKTGYMLTVSDTGAGIPKDAQQQIFDRFYRVDEARERPETASGSGAGLGLPIARWIAEAHGGSLELRRSDETGSTFVVFLPHA